MQIAIIVVLFLLYGLLNFYVGWNFKKYIESLRPMKWRWLYWSIIFLLAFSMFIGRIHETLSFFTIISQYWMFFFEYGIIFSILANLIYRLSPLKNIKLLGSVIIFCIGILFIWGSYNAYNPVTRHLQIKVDKQGEPMHIVVASDFHIGALSSKKQMKKFVEMTNVENPDLILLVGDIIDDDPKVYQNKQMSEVFRQLKSKYGVYGVLGNHEYYGGQIPLFLDEMEKSNVRILRDETISIDERLYLTGRDDRTNASRKQLVDLTPEKSDIPWIVMNHTPDNLQEPSILGANLHISGHTHRGQLFPNNLLTSILFEVDYGHEVKNGMNILVSSGYGFWGPPMRIGSRSELWIVDILFEK